MADADIESSVGQPSQVTLKTAFTVCFAVLTVAVFAVLVVKTEAALILTGLAALFAVALDHLVSLLVQRARFKRNGLAPVTWLSRSLCASHAHSAWPHKSRLPARSG